MVFKSSDGAHLLSVDPSYLKVRQNHPVHNRFIAGKIIPVPRPDGPGMASSLTKQICMLSAAHIQKNPYCECALFFPCLY